MEEDDGFASWFTGGVGDQETNDLAQNIETLSTASDEFEADKDQPAVPNDDQDETKSTASVSLDGSEVGFVAAEDNQAEIPKGYLPSLSRANAVTNRYGCYLSIDGAPFGMDDVDIETVSSLQIPKGDNIGFTVHCTFHEAQYSMVIIRILADGVPELRGEPVGTITIKGVSIGSLSYARFTGRVPVSEKLKTFCGSIDNARALPAEIIQLDIDCTKVNVSIPDNVYHLIRTIRPAIGLELDRIREVITGSADNFTRIGIIFHAGGTDIQFIHKICVALDKGSAIDKKVSHPEYPFEVYFRKSPREHQLHFLTGPWPGSEHFPFFDQVLPAVDCFDTAEEQLVPLVMGVICDYHLECNRMGGIKSLEYEARAIDLRYHGGQCFLLLVKSPEEGGVYLPREGEPCYVSLKGIRRVMPLAVDNSAARSSLENVVESCYATSNAAQSKRDPDAFIQQNVKQFFKSDQLTSDTVAEIKRGASEGPSELRIRIRALVGEWSEAGLLDTAHVDQDEECIPILSEVDECQWWKAERVPTPIIGSPAEYSTFFVTIPLVPKSEAPQAGTRPLIDVEFPLLKWDDASLTSTDRNFVSNRVKALFASKGMKLTVLFKPVFSDRTAKAAIAAINDLHLPRSADREFPVSEWSIETYKFLMDFRGGKTGSAFESYPHMKNILDNPEQVPPYLRRLWDKMDEKKKAAYRGLDKLVQNIKWIVGVAGTGKTTFLQFIILMAMFGDKDTTHQVKILYFVNHNSAVSDFADELNTKALEMDKGNIVIRLHGYESELGDWQPSRQMQHRRGEVFDREDAHKACVELDDHFMVQRQLAQMAVDTNAARERSKRSKLPYLSLNQSAYQYYSAHPDQFPELRDAIERLENGQIQDEDMNEFKETMKQLVNDLYAAYLKQFSGVISATPYTGCLSKFVRNFAADICLVDEAAKVGDPDLLQIIRKHSPKLLLVVGDPAQLGPHVQLSTSEEVEHPFQEYLKRSSLERAVCIGHIVDTPLTLNHRGYGALPALAARVIYHEYMQPAKVGVDAWPSEADAWHHWLVKQCPTLSNDSQRILIELQGVSAQQLGTSYFHMKHVEHVGSMVLNAVKDETLTGHNGQPMVILVIAMYKAQAYFHQVAFDAMAHDGLLTAAERRQIMVRTVDSSQGYTADLVFVDFTRTAFPGFTADVRRLCVSTTRARYAEVIMMSRGVFVSEKKRPEEMDLGQDPRVLSAIYEDVALLGGVVTQKVVNGDGIDTVNSEMKCHNCGQKGHGEQECTDPLKCDNCDQLGHSARYCLKPRVQRCRTCRRTDHLRADCPCCEACGEEGHKKADCTAKLKCHRCEQMGHIAKNCPLPGRCKNCNQQGHFSMNCTTCMTCGATDHHTKRCPTTKPCKRCKGFGHKPMNCPTRECAFCHEKGHHDSICPQRVIDDEVSFVPATMPYAPTVNFKKRDGTVTSNKRPAPKLTLRRQLMLEMNELVDDSQRPKGPRWGRNTSTASEIGGSGPGNGEDGGDRWGAGSGNETNNGEDGGAGWEEGVGSGNEANNDATLEWDTAGSGNGTGW